MASLTVQSLSKSFGGRDIFSDLSFEVAPGSRLAVVGPNGCGKSTLLRILAGRDDADTGRVSVSEEGGVGYVAQELGEADLSEHLLSWVLAVFPSWSDFWTRWERAVADGDEKKLARLGQEQARLEQTFGYNPEHKAESVLSGLGFEEAQFSQPMRTLSGGWRERAKLARVLVQGTGLLLLDEPTNHLDLEAVEWLEEYLLSFKGSVVFVAHDRVFLDNVASHVLYLGSSRPVVKRGNLTDFVAWQEEAEKVRRRQAEKLSQKIDHHMEYVRRFRVKARKAAQAQSKLKQVDKLKSELDDLAPEGSQRSLSFTLPQPVRAEKVVASVSEVTVSFSGHRLWKPLSFQLFRGQKVALLAPNGVGKTTLIKVLVGLQKPDEGEVFISNKTVVGYFSQHQTEILDTGNTVVGELRRLSDPRTTEEELRGVLGLFLLGEEYFDRKVSGLSGGEKNRLVLSSLFLKRANFLVLDEPTNHLDLESRQALVDALQSYEGTILMVAHDRYLLTHVAQSAWGLTPEGIEEFMGGFAEYEARRRAEQKDAPGQAPSSSGRKLDKEQKRRQAEIRNALYRELKPKKKAYDELEAELTELGEAQASLEERLADPATYADKDEFMRLTTQYQASKEREEELFERLTVLEGEIGELTAQRDAALEDA